MTGENNTHARRAWIAGFFAVLLLADWFLYFRHAGHFFQADSLYLLDHRATSVSEFFREFMVRHPSGWYRPLANEIFQSILFPFLGLDPIGYRIPVYALFIANAAAVYALAFAITRRQPAAAIAAFFFSIHTTNAFITYDLAFMPELLYTFFYLCATLAYLRYIERGSRTALGISLACFAGSLLSKESAVTLPCTLAALHLLMAEAPGWRERLVRPLMSVRGHLLILVCYLLFAVGYIQVMDVAFESLFNRPAQEEISPGSYNLVLDGTILRNVDVALTWAFNIPRGAETSSRRLRPGMLTFLKAFRVLVVGLLFVLLFRPERKAVFIGIAWFLLTVAPGLPLLDHFLPYYLFLPVAGFSLLIGVAFTWLADALPRIPVLAPAVVAGALAGMLYVCSAGIRDDIDNNRLLGGSARIALSSLQDFRRLYPSLPPAGTIYINDDEEPLWWDQSSGGLIKMAYDRDDISVLYSDYGDEIPAGLPAGKLILLRFQNRRFVDRTGEFRKNPSLFLNKASDEHMLRLSTNEVAAGLDSYSVEITGLRDVRVRIAYSIDEGPVETFDVMLDPGGRASFDVSADTRKGVYRFLAFKRMDGMDWFRAGARITVR